MMFTEPLKADTMLLVAGSYPIRDRVLRNSFVITFKSCKTDVSPGLTLYVYLANLMTYKSKFALDLSTVES